MVEEWLKVREEQLEKNGDEEEDDSRDESSRRGEEVREGGEASLFLAASQFSEKYELAVVSGFLSDGRERLGAVAEGQGEEERRRRVKERSVGGLLQDGV